MTFKSIVFCCFFSLFMISCCKREVEKTNTEVSTSTTESESSETVLETKMDIGTETSETSETSETDSDSTSGAGSETEL